MHCTALVGRLALPQVQVKVKLPDATPFETSSSWERCLSELLQQWVGLKKQRPDLIFTLLDERKQGELAKLWSFSQERAEEGAAAAGPGLTSPLGLKGFLLGKGLRTFALSNTGMF